MLCNPHRSTRLIESCDPHLWLNAVVNLYTCGKDPSLTLRSRALFSRGYWSSVTSQGNYRAKDEGTTTTTSRDGDRPWFSPSVR